MKKLLLNNLGLKLISVVIAIILWFTIVYTYDPAKSADFTIPVTIVNGDSITRLGKVYDVVQGSMVTIRVKGKTSIIKSLRSSDFKATADVSKLSPTYNANIDVVCTKTNNVEISFPGSVKMLQVSLEDLVTKQFSVSVKQSGTPSEGFYVGDSTTKPNLITVSGGKSVINKIDDVMVTVDVHGANKSFFSEAEPHAYDSEGEEIDSDSLKFSETPVSVITKVYETKEVAIFVDAKGKPYNGYTLESTDYEPKTVMIAGTESDLKNISSLTVSIDVTNKITDAEETVSLRDALPDNVFLPEPDATVSVKSKISRLESREIALNDKNITLENGKNGLEYTIKSSVYVTLRGMKKDISGVTVSKLSPEVDLSGITKAGSYSLKVSLSSIEGITYETYPNVTVIAKNADTESSTDNNATGSAVEQNNDTGNNDNASKEENKQNMKNHTDEETSNIVK